MNLGRAAGGIGSASGSAGLMATTRALAQCDRTVMRLEWPSCGVSEANFPVGGMPGGHGSGWGSITASPPDGRADREHVPWETALAPTRLAWPEARTAEDRGSTRVVVSGFVCTIRFKEGFHTVDLKTAKALLSSLQ